VLIADGGRARATTEAERLLAGGQRVVAIDPFYLGESRMGSKDFLFALLLGSIGDRPLGLQASQVASIARHWREANPGEPIELVALGPRSSLVALIAAALDEQTIDSVRLTQSLAVLRK
jgi:hypothetical protein